MLRYRFYIVPVSTITHQIVTFQRNCHSECIIWQMGQKFKETGIPLTYCIVSMKTYTQINKLKCRSNFATMYQKEKNMIEEIIHSRKKIMNFRYSYRLIS